VLSVLAVRTFKRHDCESADMAALEVEIRSSVAHTVTVKRVKEWLFGRGKNPKEVLKKKQLREKL
jgi:hypothetical protein